MQIKRLKKDPSKFGIWTSANHCLVVTLEDLKKLKPQIDKILESRKEPEVPDDNA